ncbi:OB-fold nucleic acid binding domain-containing protein [Propionibacterium sp.]|uniref:OB-fold nucleic acid binding domain-containing protein n=1 Tax=Propionibacterium sp. TaxID=1977903 RepID=UPI0039ECD406
MTTSRRTASPRDAPREPGTARADASRPGPDAAVPEQAQARGLRLPRWFRRLFSSDSDLESEELVAQSVKSGATPIGKAPDRRRVTVQGTVSAVTLNPRERHSWLEADLTDGSGTVLLVWMGRRTIAGIDPGRKLRVTGLINRNGDTPVIYNPNYELLG